jgi:phage shock protein A
MKGLIGRFSTIFKAKANDIADKMENPNEMLNYSFEKQNQLINKLRQDIVQVATSKKRLEMQKAKLVVSTSNLEEQARNAIKSNREDLARLALERKAALNSQIKELEMQINEIEKQQIRLEEAEKRLSTKVQEFKTRKEIIKAQYSAAEAQVKIKENLTGISEEFNDIGGVLDRVQEKTENMKAKSDALDEMIDSGTLTDYTSSFAKSDTDIESELNKVNMNSQVEEELMRLKSSQNSQRSVKANSHASNNSFEDKTPKKESTVIRISSKGQYEIDSDILQKINAIDDEIVSIMEDYSNNNIDHETAKDELKNNIEKITNIILSEGKPVDEKNIVNSDIIIPISDISVEEAQRIFQSKGIIAE